MNWDRYDVSVSSPRWERPAWEKVQQLDNAGEGFREFRAAIDHALSKSEACDVFLVARAGRTAQTLGKFSWAGASLTDAKAPE